MARLALRILAVVTLVILTTTPSLADGRMDLLAARLKYPPPAGQADDFRVRTNAALALGATNDDAAIPPLCGGLGDPSEVVRQAVAMALRRLARRSSSDCLRKRAAVEQNASVKLQIQRALEVIDAADGGASAARATAGAKFYVAISPTNNHTTRPGGEIERVVRDAITSKLAQLGEYQLAPLGESSAEARAAIAKDKLKGFLLTASIDAFDYSGGNLRVSMKLAVSSYPGKDMRGEVPAAAVMPGARPGDKGAEDQLMRTIAARAVELFAQNFR